MHSSAWYHTQHKKNIYIYLITPWKDISPASFQHPRYQINSVRPSCSVMELILCHQIPALCAKLRCKTEHRWSESMSCCRPHRGSVWTLPALTTGRVMKALRGYCIIAHADVTNQSLTGVLGGMFGHPLVIAQITFFGCKNDFRLNRLW